MKHPPSAASGRFFFVELENEMASYTFAQLKGSYTPLWTGMVVTKTAAAKQQAQAVIAAKARLEGIEDLTGVPWFVIGLILLREAGLRNGALDFGATLHNGQRIIGTNKKTTIVPIGRGPFKTFEIAAVDALRTYKGQSWSPEYVAYTLEKFNGFGYRGKGIPSPYLWGGTNRQKSGKYVSDGVYNASVMDPQLGGMAILKTIMQMDEDATFDRAISTKAVAAVSSPKAVDDDSDPDPELPADAVPADAITDEKTIKLVQGWLKNLGYTELGNEDGKLGDWTLGAIRDFRAEHNMPPGEYIDDALIVAIAKADKRPIAEQRAQATAADVREKVPEVKASWRTKLAGLWGAIAAGAAGIAKGASEQFDSVRQWIEPVQGYLSDVPGWAWLTVIAGGAVGVYLLGKQGEKAGVESFQTGARR